MRFFILSLIGAFLLLAAIPPAQADHFVWGDPDTGLTMSFPDTWQRVSNADPDDIITVMAPAGRGHASCRVRVRDDDRYAIYPPRYDWAVQRVSYSTDFWRRYLGEYDNYQLYRVTDGAGLGRGFASYAVAEYESEVPGPMMRRRALMFASFYNNQLYILECSAHENDYARWKNLFLSVAGSINFKKTDHELLTGHYRNFMADPRIVFETEQGEARVAY